ncbi:MAG: NAD-dependent epimerase/dehydratase family protein [Anaerolineae bacterium]|nr:NAD-dependent epimerase/dehydratase family protein [Anaerolineae bacterium]
MRVLVTGANGCVGAMLCRKLVERGDSVRGLVRKTSDLSLLEGLPVQRVVGSLEDHASLLGATQDVDIVYHVAAAVTDWGPLTYFRSVNVAGTQNVLDAAVKNHVQRFVYISSVAVHNFTGAQDMDEDSPQLPTPFYYCQTKREAESLVLSYHRQGRMPVVIVRPGDIYGPGDRVSLLPLAPMLESGHMAYVGDGRKLGAFTYVENLVDGLILAGIKKDALGEVFVITDGLKLTWREYFEKLTAALDLPKPWICVPVSLAYALATGLEFVYRLFRIQSRPPITRYLITHLSKDFHFSIEKAHRVLGYAPRVDVNEAISRTAAWYKDVVRGGRA